MTDRTSLRLADFTDLTEGMTDVYKTLIATGYFEEGDVHFPSSDADPPDREVTARLMTAGFSEEAATVIQYLPCPSQPMLDYHSHGSVPIAPDSHVMPYISAQLPSAEDMRSIRFSENTIGQHDIKISRCPGRFDTSMTSSKFDHAIEADGSGDYIEPYDTNNNNNISLNLPAKEAFRKWEAKLRTLSWLPWTDNGNLTITPQPTEYESGLSDPEGLRKDYELQFFAWQQSGLDLRGKTSTNYPTNAIPECERSEIAPSASD
ncbi:hypothetical protein LTR78_010866 [Recurvomyces mirabilis]|uniref:Uncharacterized protein n=1 Tax=Recurvomyces mirabilis TaxID=574656 RepID=A0AAE0TMK2_9PEZI|nr:hypothetical protein LTR78_010866 [Recurvomyces mirabilis]KAK5162366.1 hypothetical protein LTS14_000713 [Recurvomyces mirabilis]